MATSDSDSDSSTSPSHPSITSSSSSSSSSMTTHAHHATSAAAADDTTTSGGGGGGGDQDNQLFRRKLRLEMYKVKTFMSQNHKHLIDLDNTDLKKLALQSNARLNSVKKPRELAIEADLFATMNKFANEQIAKVQVGLSHNPDLFIQRLLDRFGKKRRNSNNRSDDDADENEDEEENDDTTGTTSGSSRKRKRRVFLDWKQLGMSCAISQFNCTPSISFMNGPLQKLEVRPDEKKKRVERKKKVDLAEERAAAEREKTQVSEIEKVEQVDEATRQLLLLRGRIKALKEVRRKNQIRQSTNGKENENEGDDNEDDDDGVSFVDLVIDPNSFTKSIENMFHLAFFVKAGTFSLELRKKDHNGSNSSNGSSSSNQQNHSGNLSSLRVDCHDTNTLHQTVRDKRDGSRDKGALDKPASQAVLKLTRDMWSEMSKQVSIDAKRAEELLRERDAAKKVAARKQAAAAALAAQQRGTIVAALNNSSNKRKRQQQQQRRANDESDEEVSSQEEESEEEAEESDDDDARRRPSAKKQRR